MSSPLYTVLTAGLPGATRDYTIALTETRTASALAVDADGDGDMTNDPPIDWQPHAYRDSTGTARTLHIGSAVLKVGYGSAVRNLEFSFYRFDPNDPGRTSLSRSLVYYCDYGLQGSIELGRELYKVFITDGSGTGAFRGPDGNLEGTTLYIDRNRNGEFAGQGEVYDLARPFRINGVTYQAVRVDPVQPALELAASEAVVAEIPPPPDTTIGAMAPPFEATTLDGRALKFPGALKGKLVLLDFWNTAEAEWRAGSNARIALLEKLSRQGLTVVAICVDPPGSVALRTYLRSHRFAWPVIAALGQPGTPVSGRYGVEGSAVFLVDAGTGKIVARGNTLQTENLAQTVETALKGLGRRP